MKKFLAILLFAMLTLGVLPALAEPADDNTLVLFLNQDPETLDGQLTTDSYTIPLNVFDRLVECDTVDGAAAIVPGLASSWETSEDGLVWTFHLNQGVKFHNGTEFTADDVVYTVNRMMNPNTLAKNTDFFSMIKGAMACFNGEAEAVEGVVALDDYTVQFTLENPYGSFLSNLATPGCAIYNREATEAAGDQFGVDPSKCIGTGPFKIVSWTLGNEVTLVANPDYFKGAPKLDGVKFLIVPDADTQRMMFESGQSDVFNFDYAPSQLAYFKNSEFKDQIVSGTRAGLYYYLFNLKIEPLNDVRVRKALQMAIDRQAILDSLFDGEGAVTDTFVPAGVLGYNPDAPKIAYDPEGAKALLSEAGYPNGFTMDVAQMANKPITQSVNEVVQAYLAQIGVTVNIKQYDEATYYAVRGEGDLPAYFNEWSADFNDPDNFLYTFFSHKNSVPRSSNYENEDVMDKLDQARNMSDQEARIALYHEIEQKIVNEDAAVLPILQKNHLFCLSERVKGFKVAWNGWSDMSFYSVYLEN